MKKIKVFISSVQKEFAAERQSLFQYLHSDPLLGLFFEPFLFENLPAADQKADTAYITEVSKCDIYIGLFGSDYGFEDTEGISPTEREFEEATRQHKIRLIFVKGDSALQRHTKMTSLIQKVGLDLIRKRFNSGSELKSGIYAALVNYLKEKDIVRTAPFDASMNSSANLDDLDKEKIAEFVLVAKTKRGFPLPNESTPETILTHLDLISGDRISNAAILLFGKRPQHFFITSEIKCAHFHGKEIVKPIPAYQVYKGDVFQLVNQAIDFVLSKIDVLVGTRAESTQVPVDYELPRAAVAEAIVNAVAHRDYSSNGSVQVMLFKDRLEIWNPGHLPLGLSPEKLRHPHTSIPANPLLAEPMYLAGYIERLGTGTGDIIRLCNEKGLKAPEFIQEEIFKTIIWRTLITAKDSETDFTRQAPDKHPTSTRQAPDKHPASTRQDDFEVSDNIIEAVRRIVLVLDGEMKRAELQELLGLKDRENFVSNYLTPSLESDYIEMTIPETPRHKDQRYRLSVKGIELKRKLEKSKR
jgi:predicted HTH transcriptional regulator